jgi:arylsulfatase A-like enzyme
MEADDGRPLFLVVHTYRVHGPMRVGPEEDGRPWQEFLVKVREDRLERARQGIPKAQGNGEFIEVGRQYYHDAVRDLDAKVGPWLAELAADGYFEHGYLALTSDHGNAYGVTGESGHGGELYDSMLRVPLALRGPGLAPRAVEGVVSLIDLPPTLVGLAGCEPPPSWPGRSLLGALPPRPSYAFDLKDSHREIALFAEGRKLMAEDLDALRAGEPTHAFDLGADPGEENDRASSMQWPGELGKALAPAIEPPLEPASGARTIELPAEVQQQLQAIGYTE